jgi:ribosomal protein S5
VTGGSGTGGGAVVVTVTVGTGREGTVGVVVVGSGSDGTVTVGTGTSAALPFCTSACADTKPPMATIKRANLPSRITPQTSDQQSATTTLRTRYALRPG